MEGLQFAGVFAFIYGILWASATVRDAKAALAPEYRESLQPIERVTVLNSLGPLLPLMAGLAIVASQQQSGIAVAVAAILLTVMLLALKGVLQAKRMRGVGVPTDYQASYRKAHAIRAVSLAVVAGTLVQPLVG